MTEQKVPHACPESAFEATDLRRLVDRGLKLRQKPYTKATDRQIVALMVMGFYLNDAVHVESAETEVLEGMITDDVDIAQRCQETPPEDLTGYMLYPEEELVDLFFDSVVIAIKAIVEHCYKRYTRERLAGAYSEKWPEQHLQAFDKVYLRIAECADHL